MGERLVRLRRRIALASAAAVALCAAACLAALCATASSSALEAQRQVLEEVSNAPFEGEGGANRGDSYLAVGMPTWIRALVDGDVLEAEAPDRSDLAPWISNIRVATDEMASRIAEMLARMGRC